MPQNIHQLIHYQNGSVVSQEIINKSSGTVTLFAFDQGQGLSEHTAPYDAMILALDGLAEITLSGVRNQVHANDLLLMPANKPHSLKALQPFKMLLIMIKS